VPEQQDAIRRRGLALLGQLEEAAHAEGLRREMDEAKRTISEM
jgi:hypothetical protein